MMGSLNLVAHLFSFAVFCVLVAFLALRHSREIWLKKLLLSVTRGEGGYVDWPLCFLSRFCEFFEIRFEGSGSLRTGPVKKLRRELFLQSLLLYGVDGIEYGVDSVGMITVRVYYLKKIADRELLERELSQALKVKVVCFSRDL